ncbi:uncharacterized protein SPPG_06346 [Spizellomyces punctatus DAOM BR117]|uniref:CBS domain-containing protein n=1 Tax=Spizellomyces punctatus (strain DAOM BR117) TaxID=645134 RepID=A0A0L0HAS9_SPIPD|nr:uncharacterized protein SPPG_06346 [Spizellomyces punctatus DAOM BR117]KNC98665.1 hypothetical protein SPPG_06346 [Spizellomyces punctatus DAOM BR117]|eukprot:XP_016606705.1 hypothetical protein SPPG_06346 [Spizellomyces punctatus DAOM BR117]
MSEFIQTTPVSTLLKALPARPLISVKDSTTVEETFDVLLANDIQAVPVWSEDEKQFISIVDVLDLLTYTAFQPVFDQELEDPSLIQQRADFLQHPVREAIGLTRESERVWTIDEDETILSLLTLMSNGIHRVLIPHTPHTTSRLVTQTDLLRFLFANNHHFDTILCIDANKIMNKQQSQHPAHENGIHGLSCTTISMHSRTIQGFKKMRNEGVRSLGVVDEEGILVATLSASDLRGLNQSRLDQVLNPPLVFLRHVHGTLPPPHTCTQRFTLGQVIAYLLFQNLLRVFVIEGTALGNPKPVGVISMSDVCCVFEEFGKGALEE